MTYERYERYERDEERVASSHLTAALLGDISHYQHLLRVQREGLLARYQDDSALDAIFTHLDTRIISLCPMVLCDRLLQDIGQESNDMLLAALGLAMFSISTHDDLVDELPTKRLDVAGLVYAGNIATLEGLKLLCEIGFDWVASEVITYVNLNHYYQTKIVTTLWDHPCTKEEYLASIQHTRYWAEVGLRAALVYSQELQFIDFAASFARCYGITCQLFDDMREIDDDVKNSYWSLPISLARANKWDIATNEGKRLAIVESRQLADQLLGQGRQLCGSTFPRLLDLIERIAEVGAKICY